MKKKRTIRFISIFLCLILLFFVWADTAGAADAQSVYFTEEMADAGEYAGNDIPEDTSEKTSDNDYTDDSSNTDLDILPDASSDTSLDILSDASSDTGLDILSDNSSDTDLKILPDTPSDSVSGTLSDNFCNAEDLPEDLLPMEQEYIPYEEAALFMEPDETGQSGESVNLFSADTAYCSYSFEEEEEQLLTSQIYESSWEQYGCYYIYNQLSDEDKLVWDKLNEFCIAILDSTGKKSNTGIVSYGSTDFAHLKSVAYMFRYSNPQYFFLKNSVVYTSKTVNEETVYYIGLGIYDAFQDGTARAEASETFFAQLESWVSEVNACSTELEKVLKIQNMICEKVVYDSEFSSSSKEEQLEQEKTKFTQSAYSALCMDSTVCAGYAQSFELCANAVGIDCIAVTSSGHEWNQVRINDSWYNLDCTWADKSTYVWHKYTLKSNDYYEADNSSHIMVSFWDGYTPPCTQNSTFSGTAYPGTIPAGTLPSPLGKLDAPEITSIGYGQDCTITISSNQADAEIYYTVNEASPSSSITKSRRYQGEFAAKSGDRISAVAVKDCYNDSEVAEIEAMPVGYRITYHLEGGINDEENPDCYYLGQSGVISLKAPVKTGYHFLGWYLDPEFTKAVTEICPPVEQNIDLYAAWEINTYEVVIDYNGSGNNNVEIYEYGSKIPEKSAVVKSGYRFLGWFLITENENRLWDFSNDIVTEDMTLKACFQKVHQITYIYDYDDEILIQTEDEGAFLTEPEINREGYTLIGWYPENRDVAWNFSKDTVTGDLTLKARWEIQHYQVTFDAGNGECSFTEKEVVYGQPYGELPEAVYDGFLFDGWYIQDSNQRVEEESLVTATGSHVLTARWITQDTCSVPRVSILPGEIYYGTRITLTCKTEGAEIYYTLDGSVPGRENGILYTGEIELTEDVTVKAVALKKDYFDSYISEFSYRIILYRCDLGEITEEHLKEYADKQGIDVHSLTDDMLPKGLWAAGLKDQVYTGNRVTCPQLQVYFGKKKLTCGEDYILRYSSNLKAGRARVLIKGKGAYKGSLREYFTILPADIQNAEAKDIVLFYKAKVQKGKPEVYFLQKGKKVKLKAGRDFVYRYPAADPENEDYDEAAFNKVGSYTIFIEGKGNFQGTLLVTQTIRRPNLPSSSADSTSANRKPQPITRKTVAGWAAKIYSYIFKT